MWKKKEERHTWVSLEEPKLDGSSSPENKLEAQVSNLDLVGQTIFLKEVDESYMRVTWELQAGIDIWVKSRKESFDRLRRYEWDSRISLKLTQPNMDVLTTEIKSSEEYKN